MFAIPLLHLLFICQCSSLPLPSSSLQPSVDDNKNSRDERQYPYHHIIPTHHHPPIFMHNINWVANGHPYKITVNNKEMKPSTNPLSPTITNPTNSPITWITNTWGFNGQPVNILSYPASAQNYWAGQRRGAAQGGRGRLVVI